MTDRKATDILLEIDRKIDLLLKYQTTNDLNQKLILDRLNRLLKVNVEHFTTVQTEMPANKPLMAKPAQMASEDINEYGEVQKEVELQPKIGRRDQRIPTQDGKKIAVQQKIVYPDGKNVIIATVEIYNMSNVLVKRTRTNSAGKWNATLDPGKYLIHITKSATTEKPLVEQRYEVEIPISHGPLELEPPKI